LLGSTIKAFLLGGPEVGQQALTRFYALHIMVIPAGIALLTSIHLWRVRKDGGLAANELDDKEDLGPVETDDVLEGGNNG
jgi:quinol-cytochrome oxidoreductase complex cytochrome b subunit